MKGQLKENGSQEGQAYRYPTHVLRPGATRCQQENSSGNLPAVTRMTPQGNYLIASLKICQELPRMSEGKGF